MPDRLEMSIDVPAAPEVIYRAWLDSRTHAEIVGAPAEIADGIGGEFRVWDGYITGRTLELDPPRRIVQAWRTTEFLDSDPDSRLELRLEPLGEGTRLTLLHSEIPKGQGPTYEAGWEDNYFVPLKKYFAGTPRSGR